MLLQIDLFARWGAPVILCASTRLGTINHSLLSIEALKRRGIAIAGIAFVGAEQAQVERTIVEIRRRARLGRLPLLDPLDRASLRAAFERGFDLAPLRAGVATRTPRHERRARRSGIRSPSTRCSPTRSRSRRAEGAWLQAKDGRRILDAISSWWVITHGHRHPRITAAIKDEADRLDQVIFAGFTHAPAERLARGLIAHRAGAASTHVFYSDSGSTSVEVALKMALGYWRNIGEPRTRILALEHGYHGDTIGAMSVGARGVFNAPYEPLLFDVGRIPFPAAGHEQADARRAGAGLREGGRRRADRRAADRRRRRHAHLYAAGAGRDGADLRAPWRAVDRG